MNNVDPNAVHVKDIDKIADAGAASPQPPTARSGLFAGKSPQIADIDAVLEEMNDLWKAKLMDLGG